MVESSNEITIFVNGRKQTIRDVNPKTTLLEYLRYTLQLTGAKNGCGVGGCGACTVMSSHFSQQSNRIIHRAIPACVVPLYTLDNTSIITVEALGSVNSKLHPIQKKFVQYHASQCGFCTPGMVMSFYTLLRNNPNPSKEEVEEALDGNLCRCTGYRPILDAMKSFAKPSSFSCGLENCCQKNNQNNSNDCQLNNDKIKDEDESEIIFPHSLRSNSNTDEMKTFEGNSLFVFVPSKLADLLSLKEKHQKNLIISAGNTLLNLQSQFDNYRPQQVVSINKIKELQEINYKEDGIEIGAASSFTDFLSALKTAIDRYPKEKSAFFQSAFDHFSFSSTTQLRNISSIGGNLLGRSHFDIPPVLIAINASITLLSSTERSINLYSLFSNQNNEKAISTNLIANSLNDNEILFKIFIPVSENSLEFSRNFKVSQNINSHSVVTGGCRIALKEDDQKRLVIKDSTFSFAGINQRPTVALKTSQKIQNQIWSKELFSIITEELQIEFKENYLQVNNNRDQFNDGHEEDLFQFFQLIPSSCALKFLHFIQSQLNSDENFSSQIFTKSKKHSHALQSHSISLPDHNTNNNLDNNNEIEKEKFESPLHQARAHIYSKEHATGEAKYIDDINEPRNLLHCSLILSRKANSSFTLPNLEKYHSIDGYVKILTANDLHKNSFLSTSPDEELFAKERVKCFNQVIGAVIAETKEKATEIANEIGDEIVYFNEEKPLLSIEDVLNSSLEYNDAFYEDSKDIFIHNVKDQLQKSPLSDDDKKKLSNEIFEQSKHKVEGELKLGGQLHYYMEPHSTLVIPDENHFLNVFATTQDISSVQSTISSTLLLPLNKINVQIVRLGGGFGGKCARFFLSAIAALAAHLSHRPVKLTLTRSEDIAITGYRADQLIKYKAAADDEGKLTYLEATIYSNGGHSEDFSVFMVGQSLYHLENSYKWPVFVTNGIAVRTNITSNKAMRGAGAPEGLILGELILEHVCRKGEFDPLSFRVDNLLVDQMKTSFGHPLVDCNLKKVIEKGVDLSNYFNRRKEIEAFNLTHKLKKRGIAIMPIKIGMGIRLLKAYMQAYALLHIYRDGSVFVHHQGVEMGQGLHVKIQQIVSHLLQVDPDHISIFGNSTRTLANSQMTGASWGSDENGHAISLACQKLISRLLPIKNQLIEKGKGNPSLAEVAEEAFEQGISLSEHGHYASQFDDDDEAKGEFRPYGYYSYGSAVSEVEIDVLTGDHRLLRTDIVFDAGKSLNPAVDIGQIEGGFVQGLGWLTSERIHYRFDGKISLTGPADYDIPFASNVPEHFSVNLLDAENKSSANLYNSKAIGEPPMNLAASVVLAIKDAIYSARVSNNLGNDYFRLDLPATIERIRIACGSTPN